MKTSTGAEVLVLSQSRRRRRYRAMLQESVSALRNQGHRGVEVGRPIAQKVLGLLALVALTTSPGWSQTAATAKEQLSFGVEMAERGLWSEALFRFRQAERLEPTNPTVLNNIAVSFEALGKFELALAHYRRGLELDPEHRGLRQNYARFVEFYRRFKPPEEEEPDGATQSSPVAPAPGEPPTGTPL